MGLNFDKNHYGLHFLAQTIQKGYDVRTDIEDSVAEERSASRELSTESDGRVITGSLRKIRIIIQVDCT